jgi:molybdopterin/thiamine biosynthesis adenylyltransferase
MIFDLLNDEQKTRYHRNIIVPGIDETGQAKLLNSSAVIIGCGGLGSASSFYLAAAGIGRIGLVDGDDVELSNLQRQILHSVKSLGLNKARSAGSRLGDLNPSIDINCYPVRLTTSNTLEILQHYDVIIDGTDNLATRYMINDFACSMKKPVILAAVREFFGQMTTFIPGKTSCYKCNFPENTGENELSAGPPGVLSPLPGIMGTLQALEAIKIITETGKTLAGRLLVFDGYNMKFEIIECKKNPVCSVCGKS